MYNIIYLLYIQTFALLYLVTVGIKPDNSYLCCKVNRPAKVNINIY